MTHLRGVPPSELDEWWPKALPWIEPACERGGLFCSGYVRGMVSSGLFQLWLAEDDGEVIAVLVTEIRTYPDAKICNFVIGTGKHRRKWQHLRSIVEDWASEQGCKRMRVEARTGWARVFLDYRPTHTILEKDL